MVTNNKYCCIFIYASHYREEIYKKMESELDVDFVFGDGEDANIKKIDYTVFSKKVTEVQTIKLFSNFVYVRKTVGLCFKDYQGYILTGEPYNLSSWIVLLLNKILRKKTYLWTHGYYGKESKLRRIFKKIYFSLATKNLLYGEYAKNIMLNEGFDADKLEVIYNSLDYENQLVIRQTLKESSVFKDFFINDYPVILFTGRLKEVKKLDQLLFAQKTLFEQGFFVNVFIVGKGTEKENLVELSKTLGLQDHVHFYGACYDEKILADFYHNANVCVSPGNVGLTAIHAMAYGCSVISHDNFKEQMPEFEAIFDGKTGFFFRQNNINDLAKKIKLASKQDKTETRKNCFEIIDAKFNTRYQIELLKRILQKK